MIVMIICYFFMLVIILLFMMSSSFIFCWMLMECSTLIFLSLICLNNVNQKFMSISSYFLIQVFSSSLFLLSLTFLFNNMYINIMGMFLYNLSLSMKIGLFPFYNWVISLVYNMNWFSIGLMSTYQKFMPMMMLSMNMWYMYIYFISFVGMIVSMYYSLGLVSVKLIFSYSILSHSGWMSLMLSNMSWWLLYYLLYSIMFMMICLFNYYFSIEDMMDYLVLMNTPFYYLLMYLLNIVSLSGMPPFSGFLIKLMMINYFYEFLVYIYLFILVMSSVVHFYVYIRVLLTSIFIYLGKSKHMVVFFNYKFDFFFMFFSMSFMFNLFLLFLGFNFLY